MLLDRIDILGFKSFARKTQVRFSPGITCVVGPNGCGKSNIADAIRWALGEQNVRQLRGKSLTDVIFKGTREVKPAGMAEIILHMDNQEQRLATEYAQVAIQRRAFRSGESEFLINKAPCRLKDIRGLFMDTGLGSSQYAVIEREMIDEVLSDRDDARRFLVDEASGITRYKQRRKETLRKLDAVEQDLTRVEDVLEIEERQVRSLSYQMGKARRHRRLSERIQKFDVALARLSLQDLQAAASGESHHFKEAEREKTVLTTALRDLDARQEELRLELLECDRRLTEARGKLHAADEQLGANREETLVRKERQRALAERIAELGTRIENGDQALARAEAEALALAPRVAALTTELTAQERVVTEAERDWTRSEAALKGAREHLARHQQIHIEHVKKHADADHRIRSVEERLADLDLLDEKVRAQVEALDHRTATLGEEIGRHQDRKNELTGRQEELAGELEVLGARALAAEGGSRGLTEQLSQLGDEVARVEARLSLLEEQARTHEGYGEGVARLLAEGESLPGVIGVAAELLTIAPEWATRLAPALGDLTEWVVTDTEESAWAAIAFLRDQRLGQVTFAPMQTIGTASGPADELGLPPEAIIAREPIAEALAAFVRRYLVPVEDASAVAALTTRLPGRRWVTPAGEIIASEGWINAGGTGDGEARLWSRPEEIAALQARLEKASEGRAQLEADRALVDALIADLAAKTTTLSRELKEIEGEGTNVARTLAQKQAEERLLSEEAQRLRGEASQIEARRTNAHQDLEGSRQDHTRMEMEEGSADAIFRQAQAAVEEASSERDRLGERLSERKLEALVTQGQVKELRSQSERKENEICDLTEQTAAARMGLEDADRESSAVAERFEVLREEEGDLVTRREMRQAEVDRHASQRMHQESRLMEIEKGLRENRRQLSEIEETLRHDEVQLARFEAECRRLLDRIQDQYGLDLAELPPLERPVPATPEPEGAQVPGEPMSPAEEAQAAASAALAQSAQPAQDDDPLEGRTVEDAQEELTKLRHDRDRLGPVNQLAIEEYEEKREHVLFVKEQRDDLTMSKEALLAAIERINTEARRLFEETFTKVQENFTTTFGTLFPGGEAQLRLAGEDPLEADIEIMARPRGKRLTSIHLLSSGERCLTATALLFALYLVKPSPFCVLDEVDAPLDDANIDRFLTLLRTFSQRTQFVVITHNKRTMEVADTLYGVTMQDPGISKIVSVRLEGGEIVAEDQEDRPAMLQGSSAPATE